MYVWTPGKVDKKIEHVGKWYFLCAIKDNDVIVKQACHMGNIKRLDDSFHEPGSLAWYIFEAGYDRTFAEKVCALYIAHNILKRGRKKGLKRLDVAMKSRGLDPLAVRNTYRSDALGRSYRVANSRDSIVVFWNSVNTYRSFDGIFADIDRYGAWLVGDQSKFVTDPGESGVCYDGAIRYDLKSNNPESRQVTREDKYIYSARSWEWVSRPVARPYRTDKHAVRLPSPEHRPVILNAAVLSREFDIEPLLDLAESLL